MTKGICTGCRGPHEAALAAKDAEIQRLTEALSSRSDAGGGRAELHRADIVRAVKDVRAAERLDDAVDLAIMLLVKRPGGDQGVREAQLRELVEKWRREADDEGLLWTCSDELDAVLTSGVREAPAEPQACGWQPSVIKGDRCPIGPLQLHSFTDGACIFCRDVLPAPPVALAPADKEQE